jgi:hypothetical protein
MSNLQKYDSDKWSFYIEQKKNATDILEEGVYTYEAWSLDELGNWNNTDLRTINIGINSAPYNPIVYLNSTNGTNKTNEDLNCYATISDPDGDNMNVSVEWYKNNELNLSFEYGESYANGSLFIATLDNGNTTKADNWTCGVRLYDGALYSDWSNASIELAIANSKPVVNLTGPGDKNSTTDRTPTFEWNASDDDNENLSYEINISLTAGSTCYEPDRYITGITETNYTPTDYLKCLWDNLDNYTWEVRAYDGEEYSDWAGPFSIKIDSEILISLPVSDVDFGGGEITDVEDTTDGSPAPLKMENSGNVLINLTMNFTYIWESIQSASNYYRFKARNTTTGCFNYGNSVTDWANASNVPDVVLSQLNFTSGYQAGCNNSLLDIFLEVPRDESPGNKSSIVSITASLGEAY